MSRYLHVNGDEGVMLISNNPSVVTFAQGNPLDYTQYLQFHSELPYLKFGETVPSTPVNLTFAARSTQTISRTVSGSCFC